MKKQLFIFSSLVVIILIVMLAALPRLMSTEVVKDQALRIVNKRIPGQLSISQWSLHWFGDNQLKGLSYEEMNRNLTVQVDEISLSKGLMALIFNYREPGRIDILNPHIAVQLAKKADPANEADPNDQPLLEKTTPSEPEKSSSNTPNKTAPNATTFFQLPNIKADLKITGGEVEVAYADRKKEIFLKDVTLDANIDEPGESFAYRLLARSGKGTGRISGQGSIVIPSEVSAGTESIRSEADITITAWDMRPVLAILSAVYGFPAGEGKLNGQFQVAGSTTSGIQLTGQLIGTDVEMTGGPLKTDTPSIKKITCDIDAIQTGNTLTINRIGFDSLPVSGWVKGHQDIRGKSRLNTEAALNLAEIFRQLPNTLNLKPGTKITDGVVNLKAMVAVDERGTQFDGQFNLDRLAGIRAKKRLAWTEPIKALIAGSFGDDEMHLDKLNVHSSFLSAEGEGNLDKLQIRLKADIQAALREASKFIDTKGWQAAGQMILTLNAGNQSEKGHFLEADMDVEGLQLDRQNKVVIPKGRLTSRMKTDFRLDDKSRLSTLSQTSIEVDSWLGSAQAKMDRLVFGPDKNPSTVENLTTHGEYDLKLLSILLNALDLFPAETFLSGNSKIDAIGHFDEKSIRLEKVTLGAVDFNARIKGKDLEYKKIQLTSKGTITPAERFIDLGFLNIDADGEHIHLSPLTSTDWSNLVSSLTTHAMADINLSKIHPVLPETIPESIYPWGQVRLDMNVKKTIGATGMVTGKVESHGFLLGEKSASQKPQPLNIQYKGQYTTDQAGKIGKLIEPSLQYEAWLGQGRLSSDQIEWAGDKGLPRLKKIAYEGTLVLGSLSRIMQALKVLPTDTSLKGKAEIQTVLSSDKDSIAFEDTTVNIAAFECQQGNNHFQDKKVTLQSKGRINVKDHSAQLAPLKIKTTAATVKFPELTIENWEDILHAVKGNGTAKLDLSALTLSLGDFLNLPTEMKIAGAAEIAVAAQLTDAKKQTITIETTFSPIKIDSKEKSLVAEDRVNLKLKLAGDLAAKNQFTGQLALLADALSINATGQVLPHGKERLLSADGDLAVDLKRLQNPLNALLDTEVIMSGKSNRPFSVRIETKNGKWHENYKRVDLKAALHADQMQGFGLDLKAIDIPVNIENIQARANIRGTVNGGELALQPTIHMADDPPVLILPADSKILHDTNITKELANELLILIHPIFIGTTAAQGKVDLVMQQMSWPLAAAARKEARFEGSLKFKDVRINAEGLIYDLLKVMRVEERDVFLDERTVQFSGQDGRIRCSPLRISVKGYQMEVGGTMGFDGSLDYTAKIPVTPDMVGEKVYPYVKDTIIDIPIAGTVSNPKLNLDGLKTMVKKMIRGAGGRVIEKKAGDFLKKIFE